MFKLSCIALATAFLAISVIFVAGCDSPGDPIPELATLEVAPAMGATGTTILITNINPAGWQRSAIELMIGGRPTSVRLVETGLVAVVPLFWDQATKTVLLPEAALDLSLKIDGVLVGVAKAAFTVESLPPAPGAGAILAADLATSVSGLREFMLSLPSVPSFEQGLQTAWLGAADTLLTGDHEYSLPGMIAQLANDEPELALAIDAMIEASGLRAQTALLAEQATALSDKAQRMRAEQGYDKTTDLSDLDLATRMQLYTMMHDFGTQVIAETNSTWSAVVGTIAGGIGIVQTIPFVSQISAVMSIIDFSINKVALGFLPASIEEFEIRTDEVSVAPGELVTARVYLKARNDPPAIGIQDMVSLALLGMGTVGNSPTVMQFRDFLVATANWYLGVVRTLLSAYAAQNPEVPMDIDIASIPSMTWETIVTTPRFLDVGSFTPDVIAPEPNNVAWRAGVNASGEGRLWARTASGPEVISLPLIPGYEYNAGAFGTDIKNTPTRSFWVVKPLVVVAEMDGTINHAGLNALTIRAGYYGATGDTTWTDGILVSCTVQGGGVDPASGLTGADGRFHTLVSLDDLSSDVTVSIVATGDNDTQASTVSTATAGESLAITASLPAFLDAETPTSVNISTFYTGSGGAWSRNAGSEVTVELSAVGGTVSPSSFTVDDIDGINQVTVTMDPEAPELVLSGTATDANSLSASFSQTAINPAAIPIRLTDHYLRTWQIISNDAQFAQEWHSFEPFEFTRTRTASSSNSGGADVETSLTLKSTPTFATDGRWTGLVASGYTTSVGNAGGAPLMGYSQTQIELTITISEGTWAINVGGRLLGNSEDRLTRNISSFGGYINRSSEVTFESGAGSEITVSDNFVVGPGVYNLVAFSSSRGFTLINGVVQSFDLRGEFDLEITVVRQ